MQSSIFRNVRMNATQKKILDIWTFPEQNKSNMEKNWIEKAKKVFQILKTNSIEKEKSFTHIMFKKLYVKYHGYLPLS